MTIPFQNTFARLPAHFYSPQQPASVPRPELIRFNAALAAELGIGLAPGDLEPYGPASRVFSGNEMPPGAEPLAQAYAGHQFGGFVPRLGDGRAILLGEVIDSTGVRRDIQLKGAGRTAFSRGGDGRAALGPAMREYLVSEAMHALGIPTTRALALVTTGGKVLRQDGHRDGAVFTRTAASHLRVGTFQYFAAQEDVDGLRTLTDFAIARHYPSAAAAERPALAFLSMVVAAQASLVARWMGVGFIHGVMNTDNCSISGETIDYGPCAFMDAFHPQCVFSAIDVDSRYAWGNQPGIAQWNLARLAEALLPVLADGRQEAVDRANLVIDDFAPQFDRHYHTVFCGKFGLAGTPSADRREERFIQSTLDMLAALQVDFTLFFRRLTQCAESGETRPLAALCADAPAFPTWLGTWQELTGGQPDLAAMRRANPVLIPRNHRIEQAIQAGYRGDFSVFHRLARAWEQPRHPAPDASLEAPPGPEEMVHQTFCGT